MKDLKPKEDDKYIHRLNHLSIKEIVDKYPDKYVDVYAEGKNAVLVLDTCRIKFLNTKVKGV